MIKGLIVCLFGLLAVFLFNSCGNLEELEPSLERMGFVKKLAPGDADLLEGVYKMDFIKNKKVETPRFGVLEKKPLEAGANAIETHVFEIVQADLKVETPLHIRGKFTEGLSSPELGELGIKFENKKTLSIAHEVRGAYGRRVVTLFTAIKAEPPFDPKISEEMRNQLTALHDKIQARKKK